ncbi:hypothetical protein ACFP1Z_26785 [Streptomyces gamaensis]|uniref:Uncharacterized protein n=1 Tax=Streptomyces gamaensis TaxID=1763542 RepID=A0ABW0Z509_9ACTN
MSPGAAYTAAADRLARRVLGALRGAEDTASAAPDPADDLADLAAYRLVGADLFSPHVLTGLPFPAEDAAAVARSFEAFPPAVAGPGTRAGAHAVAWQDWATARLLSRIGGGAPPVSAVPPESDSTLTDSSDWPRWCVRMAQLSPLATPALQGPVHDAARAAPLALCRGLTRSILRHDFPTAARVLRWLALLRHEGAGLPLDPLTALEHIQLLGVHGPRTDLDLAVSRHLLSPAPRATAGP